MVDYESLAAKSGGDDGPVIVRRPLKDSSEMDITPMIDITFLLLIFFLVASTPDAKTDVALAPARYGRGVDEKKAVIVTVADRGRAVPAAIYLADGKRGTPLPDDPQQQRDILVDAIRKGVDGGKPFVLVKAERSVRHGDVVPVAEAAGEVEGAKLHFAVFEIE